MVTYFRLAMPIRRRPTLLAPWGWYGIAALTAVIMGSTMAVMF